MTMRVENHSHLSYTDTVIVLTREERAALANAADIAERMRELARRHIGPGFEDHGEDTLLAEIEHNAREIASEGMVSITTVEQGRLS
jgi:hypothetical protein